MDILWHKSPSVKADPSWQQCLLMAVAPSAGWSTPNNPAINFWMAWGTSQSTEGADPVHKSPRSLSNQAPVGCTGTSLIRIPQSTLHKSLWADLVLIPHSFNQTFHFFQLIHILHVDREIPIVLDALWIQSNYTDNSKSSASSDFETKGKMQKAQQTLSRE